MLRRNLGKRIAGAIILFVAVLLAVSPPAFAAEPHEDPDAAEQVFNGVSLLIYYSEALDFLIQGDPAGFEARLKKIDFANLPPGLQEASGELAQSAISMSHLLVEIDGDMDELRKLREQYRSEEAIDLAGLIRDKLTIAINELEYVAEVIETVAEELKISSAPAGSELRRADDEVSEKINRIREMDFLYYDLLTDLLTETEEMGQLLKPTGITLATQPTTVFVGDNIRFEGVLTSGAEPLAGREVVVLANGTRYITVKTDPYGHYQGTLQVPYWYVPELRLQALYSPQDKDKGVYLASLSPAIKLEVLFYEASLEIAVGDKTYPGLETAVSGNFGYDQSPPLTERRVEIYVDNVLTSEFVAQEYFSREIKIDPEIDVGEHIITVSSPAVGRYAPADASVILNITRAIPVLDIVKPNVAMIPGSVKLEGKLYSEVGPLSEAAIKIRLGKSWVESVSSEDGAFSTKIKVGMGLSLIGWQDLVIQALPGEPWHASLNTTSRIFMFNAVNCGILIALILLLGIYLPARLRRRLGAYTMTAARPTAITVPPETATAYSQTATVLASAEEADETSTEPRNRIFQWYRLAVRVIQGTTKALLKPQQTLREFAEESSRVLGPAARYFIEFTRVVERLLYSQYRPTEKDVEMSRELSDKIEEAGKLRATTEDLLGEGISGAREIGFGGRVAKSAPWRQPATWLLILAAAFIVGLLLFLLSLVIE